MKKRLVVLGVTTSILLSLFPSKTTYAQRKWNNPEAHERYRARLREAIDARRNESEALKNYDRELGRAQDDVRRIGKKAAEGSATGAAVGAITGGPVGAVSGGAAGAAVGAAKGAGQGIYERGKDYYKDRYRK